MQFKISLSILLALIISGCGDRVPVEINGTPSSVTPSSNITLIANAGEDKTIKVNQYIVLQGQGSSSDNSAITYQWSEGSRVLSTNNLYPYPTTRSGTHTLQLTITNSSGAKATDTMILNITSSGISTTTTINTTTNISTTPLIPLGAATSNGTNQPPVVNAGIDKSTKVKSYIVMTGTASDPDGTIVSYQWTKNSSILSNQESFTYSPSIVGVVILTLTVTDNGGAKSSDSISINVLREDGSSTTSNTSTPTIPIITPTSSDYQIKKLGSSISIDSTISLGNTPKSLYLLLSNSGSSPTTPTLTTTAVAPKRLRVADSSNSYYLEKSPILKAPQYIDDFDIEIPSLIAESRKRAIEDTSTISSRAEDIVGNSVVFYLNRYGTERTTATARKIISNISTNMGVKTLNIWVSNDAFDSGRGCSKANCVTQTMVDGLANSFLKSGLNNDIYDWVTNIYGEEWGSNSGLLPPNDEITILLTDIDGDNNPNGGVIGFFWSKDNFKDSLFNASNERVMFYVDAVMFANKEGGVWSMNTFWAKETMATLAHEFQHMISFYQKEILQNTKVDKWLDEMLSEATEDMLATKLQQNGPRGVSYLDGSAGTPNNPNGKYPRYNIYNTLSLTDWTNEAKQYSKVSAFGTFLVRNYGGAKLLHDIIYNSFGDERAVVDAVNLSPNGYGKNFADLLHEWGIAVMLSEYDNLINMPTYNSGDFSYSTYNSSTYKMGSINFFNYTPAPMINTILSSINPNSNYFYKIGDNLTGDVTVHLKLNGNTEVTLIAK